MKNNFLNKMLFCISGISTTILLTNLKTNLVQISIAIMISAILQLFIVFKLKFLEKISVEFKNKLLLIIISMLSVCGYLLTFLWRSELKFSPLIMFLAFSSFLFIYKIYEFILYTIQKYKCDIFKYKKIYLYYSIWAIIIFVFTLYIFKITSALTYPISINGISENNTIFGSDVASFCGYKNHLFIGDQLRHPALTIIMMPILMFIYIIALIFSMIFNMNMWVLFSLFYSGLQALVYALIATMIFALLKDYMTEKISFWGGWFYLSTFSTILFTTMIERFSVELIFLFLFVILVTKQNNEKNENFIFTLASLSVVSSIFIYPIKVFKEKLKIKDLIKTIKLGLTILTSLFILGRGTLLFSFGDNVQANLRYVVGSIFDSKSLQYLSFESGIFTAPNWVVLYKSHYNIMFPAAKFGEFADGIIIQAYPQENIYYIVGFIIIILTVLSFVLNRKLLLAKVSFYWFGFGAFLLGIVGLGSTYNEMALYLSYFSWAQIILFIMLINKLFKNEKIKYAILILATILLFYININTLVEMANALSVNYPPLH